MRKKKIAMFLAMALTLTQSVGMTVPVAAEELEIDAGQEEVFQDDSDVETTVDEETASGEEVSIQEEAVKEIFGVSFAIVFCFVITVPQTLQCFPSVFPALNTVALIALSFTIV